MRASLGRTKQIAKHLSTAATSMSGKERVAIIGSGNWGSAAAILIGNNVKRFPDQFEEKVSIWVFDEQVGGRSLVDIFNEKHENVKYLPGHRIPENVHATGNVVEAAEGATALVFVMPHQFIASTCEKIKDVVAKSSNVKAISLVKGVNVQQDKISTLPEEIEEILGIPCSALSGANIANEIAAGDFSETTIGYKNRRDGEMWKNLFHTNHFRVSLIEDVHGVALCGALKNVVAMAAGFSDGLGWGSNSKAALMRIGLLEMKHFSQEFFSDIKDDTFLAESCGVADLITSCIGGRNRKCAEAFVKTKKPLDQLEEELLGGQKLQGAQTAEELHKFLAVRGREQAYPLFSAVYRIAYENYPPEDLTKIM